MTNAHRVVLLLVAGGVIGGGCGMTDPDPAEGGVRVLFVGNSLTYTNDLPNTLATLAASAGDTITVAAEVGPGLALIDHLTGSTNAARTIERGHWDYVILQQGPTPAGICRDSLVLWAGMFDRLIRDAGAEPAVMMTWPASSNRADFDVVRESFQRAAATIGGAFLPVGEAWWAAWVEEPSLGLYGSDGFHPSPLGTFLAALVIYERVTGRDPRTLGPDGFVGTGRLGASEAVVRLLQRAAHDANSRFPAHPTLAPRAPRPATAVTQC